MYACAYPRLYNIYICESAPPLSCQKGGGQCGNPTAYAPGEYHRHTLQNLGKHSTSYTLYFSIIPSCTNCFFLLFYLPTSLFHTLPSHAVVIWCHLLGDIYSWEDSLPSSGPTYSSEHCEEWTQTGVPRQPSMLSRYVSTQYIL